MPPEELGSDARGFSPQPHLLATWRRSGPPPSICPGTRDLSGTPGRRRPPPSVVSATSKSALIIVLLMISVFSTGADECDDVRDETGAFHARARVGAAFVVSWVRPSLLVRRRGDGGEPSGANESRHCARGAAHVHRRRHDADGAWRHVERDAQPDDAGGGARGGQASACPVEHRIP